MHRKDTMKIVSWAKWKRIKDNCFCHFFSHVLKSDIAFDG